jgi:hypothetical protein
VEILSLARFQGLEGNVRLVEALRAQTLVHDEDLAVELAKRVTLKAIPAGTVLMTQDAADRSLSNIERNVLGYRQWTNRR